ncbi:MAG: response regulator transcription factor [Deltaproteobacteria bacterium]|nr:response regulator transcription factor [Deltaproteobacteria bacterium]
MPTKVLIMSLYPDEAKILNTARAGARGYILKTGPSAALLEALRAVCRGRMWVARLAGCADGFALLAHRAKTGDIGEAINPIDVLSRRELEVLTLIARGVTNDETGKKLFISVPTVKAHISSIFSKLNVKNRTQAALLLMQSRSRGGQDFFMPGLARRQIGGIGSSAFAHDPKDDFDTGRRPTGPFDR